MRTTCPQALEGDSNELGQYGYNRDGKKGKLQNCAPNDACGRARAVGEEDDAITPEDALLALGRVTYLDTTDRNGEHHTHLPRPDPHRIKILDALGLSIPLEPKAVKRAV